MTSAGPVDTGGRPPDDGLVVARLMAAAGGGEPAAWDALVGRFSGLVWAIARAHRLSSADAAEVTQSVWLKLVENLVRIREPSSVGAWLAQVTRHECLRRIRQTSRAAEVADRVDNESPPPTGDIDARLLADELSAALWRACERLPPQWCSLMRLLTVEPRLSYAEISAALDMPIGSIGPIRQRCVARLRVSPELTALAELVS